MDEAMSWERTEEALRTLWNNEKWIVLCVRGRCGYVCVSIVAEGRKEKETECCVRIQIQFSRVRSCLPSSPHPCSPHQHIQCHQTDTTHMQHIFRRPHTTHLRTTLPFPRMLRHITNITTTFPRPPCLHPHQHTTSHVTSSMPFSSMMPLLLA